MPRGGVVSMTSEELAAEIHRLEGLVRIHVGKFAALNLAIQTIDGEHQILGGFVLKRERNAEWLPSDLVISANSVEDLVQKITSHPTGDHQ